MARGDLKVSTAQGDPAACAKGCSEAGVAAATAQPEQQPPTVRDEQSIDEFLTAAASAPADSGAPMELPPWFDWHKFRRGQEYLQRNLFSLFIGKLAGLMAVLAIPSILRVLVMTRQSCDAPLAFKRYASTLAHMMDWYRGDLLEPASKAYQSLHAVRSKHSAAARRSRKCGLGLMSQLDMVLTQFGFMGFALVSPHAMGVAPSKPEDVEGFVHFWRTVGYLLGIEDRFNLCREDAAQTRILCQALKERIFRPSLSNQPAEFDVMARALVSGMKCTIPQLDYEAFLRFLTEDLLGLSPPPGAKLPLWSRFTLRLQRWVCQWVMATRALACLVRPFLNANLRLAIYLTDKFPFLAYWRFGKQQVHV